MIRAYAAALGVLVVFAGLAVFTLFRLADRVGYASFALIAIVGAVVALTVFMRMLEDLRRLEATAPAPGA
jgi:amino acid permease